MLIWKYCGGNPIRTDYWRGDLDAIEGIFCIEDYRAEEWQLTSRLPLMTGAYAERFNTAEEAKIKAEEILVWWLDKARLQVREEK